MKFFRIEKEKLLKQVKETIDIYSVEQDHSFLIEDTLANECNLLMESFEYPKHLLTYEVMSIVIINRLEKQILESKQELENSTIPREGHELNQSSSSQQTFCESEYSLENSD